MPDSNTSAITQKVWSLCVVLYDDGVSYGDYLEQITYLKRIVTMIGAEQWVAMSADVKGDIDGEPPITPNDLYQRRW